jgi:ABC-type sugar transport system ATPase subunit
MTGAASAHDNAPALGPAALLLEVRGVSKRFPGVLALSDIRLTLARGEVLALIGENGAGKSTLMKILAGIQKPDMGEILLDGHPVQLNSVRDAQTHGIALIHQELNLADNLDVGANLFLGREPRTFLRARSSARCRSAINKWSKTPRRFPPTLASSSWTSRRAA